MMRTLVFALLLAGAYATSPTCPNYRDWMPWTEKCLWFPLEQMTADALEACDITMGAPDAMPTYPPLPDDFPTEPCGHCGFKYRCRKRQMLTGCGSPVDEEIQYCHDGTDGDICNLPSIAHQDLGCKYALLPAMLTQCSYRPGVNDVWKDLLLKWRDMAPKFHCQQDGENCKCCCHPYVPSEDGSSCELHEEPTCEEWTDWKGWSEKCLFFPPAEMKKDVEEHCDFEFKQDMKKNPLFDKFKLPGGLEPTRCGMCSFKINCRQRPVESAAGKKECFPLDMQKMACGNDDCEGCGDICELPKLPGPEGCAYSKKLRAILGPAIKSRVKKAPPSMRHGMINLISGMPHGKCVEKDGKCMCCCHPYEPNADGTECVVRELCKMPDELGMEFNLNLDNADDSFWIW
jgi:hypothetical protein